MSKLQTRLKCVFWWVKKKKLWYVLTLLISWNDPNYVFVVVVLGKVKKAGMKGGEKSTTQYVRSLVLVWP